MKPNRMYFDSGPFLKLYDTGRSCLRSQMAPSPLGTSMALLPLAVAIAFCSAAFASKNDLRVLLSGTMSRFMRRSDVEIEFSLSQVPCSVGVAMPRELEPPTYTALSFMYVVVLPRSILPSALPPVTHRFPMTDRPEPMRANDRKDNEEPILTTLNIESDDPRRAKLRRDSEEPSCRKSTTDSEAPKRARPTSASELPKRAKLRNERDEPTRV
mmetsp:Transcript_35972/g.65011  ORF Transcript_35972/g.65011 Transcript_35972/m.65011 type:complete len:213 (+) Transcript_35972:2-640(+)